MSTAAFTAALGSSRGRTKPLPDVGTTLNLTAGLKLLTLRLDDDEPLGDDPGGLHVTVWHHAQGKLYLMSRMPAQQALDAFSRPGKHRVKHRFGITAAGSAGIVHWLRRALAVD